MVELKLLVLYDYIDIFLIIEGTHTYRAQKREKLLFNINDYPTKYHNKIRYIVYDGYYDPNDSWENEIYIRSYLREGLFDAHDDDLIIISDVDEIIDPKILDYFDAFKYEMGLISMRMLKRHVNLVITLTKIEDDLEKNSLKFWYQPKIMKLSLAKKHDFKLF